MSNITGGSGSGRSFSSGNTNGINGGGGHHHHHVEQDDDELLFNSIANASSTAINNINDSIITAANHHHPAAPHLVKKKKRNLPGNPDPKAEVIALSPRSLLATNRFICEICNKGFQRDQNLQLHRRGHNLPWKLKQRNAGVEVRKRVYVCPEPGCVHHNPARALGDLTGIKKHFCRKHGEKKWKCDKCSKKYAVQSDWKAHGKTCGTKEYKCDCGTVFSRRDSFITHRAFCDALAEENNKPPATTITLNPSPPPPPPPPIMNSPNNIDHFTPLETKINPFTMTSSLPRPPPFSPPHNNYHITTTTATPSLFSSSSATATSPPSSLHLIASSASMSATALLQKAAQMGSTIRRPITLPAAPLFGSNDQQGIFMDQFFHVAAAAGGGGGIFHANFPGSPTGFFDDGGRDNNINNNHNNNNNAAALLKNFAGGDVMTTVDFLGVNNNGGNTSEITRISNMVPRFNSPPL